MSGLGAPNKGGQGAAEMVPDGGATPDLDDVRAVIGPEYALLTAALTATWSTTASRTSLYLAVLSAAVVALGLFAQAIGSGPHFNIVALVLVAAVLFLGLTTFIRQVQASRETIIYSVGLNRLRFLIQSAVPSSKSYFVLSAHDDEYGLYRGLGTGMRRHQPRSKIVYALVQVHGVVAVVNASVAGAFLAILMSALGLDDAVLIAAALLTFVITVALQMTYWARQVEDVRRSIRPLNPSTAADIEAPF